jgi:hypothetical protein
VTPLKAAMLPGFEKILSERTTNDTQTEPMIMAVAFSAKKSWTETAKKA